MTTAQQQRIKTAQDKVRNTYNQFDECKNKYESLIARGLTYTTEFEQLQRELKVRRQIANKALYEYNDLCAKYGING